MWQVRGGMLEFLSYLDTSLDAFDLETDWLRMMQVCPQEGCNTQANQKMERRTWDLMAIRGYDFTNDLRPTNVHGGHSLASADSRVCGMERSGVIWLGSGKHSWSAFRG